jgi:hypothetical protein
MNIHLGSFSPLTIFNLKTFLKVDPLLRKYFLGRRLSCKEKVLLAKKYDVLNIACDLFEPFTALELSLSRCEEEEEDCVEAFHPDILFKSNNNPYIAAKKGYLSSLKYFTRHFMHIDNRVLFSAGGSNRLKCFQHILENISFITSNILNSLLSLLIEKDHVQCCKVVLDKYYRYDRKKPFQQVIDFSSSCASFQCLKYFMQFKEHMDLSEVVYETVTFGFDHPKGIKCLKYVVEHGCPFSEDTYLCSFNHKMRSYLKEQIEI